MRKRRQGVEADGTRTRREGRTRRRTEPREEVRDSWHTTTSRLVQWRCEVGRWSADGEAECRGWWDGRRGKQMSVLSEKGLMWLDVVR